MCINDNYFCGVIEGFYGKPWSWSDRTRLIHQLQATGLNTYMYAPKFDLNHRWLWKNGYSPSFLNSFSDLCNTGNKLGIRIILSLSPGLSISVDDTDLLLDRFKDLADTGPTALALLMDDIPNDRADAAIQCKLINKLDKKFGDDFELFFCPTAYSGWHLKTWPGARNYLLEIASDLPDKWQIFWTGNSIIPKTITSDDVEDIRYLLRRKPVIWDNYSADDYVPASSVFPGPVTGRSPDLLNSTSGLLLNPSDVFSVSKLAIHSLASWFKSPENYIPELAFNDAIKSISSNETSQQILKEFLGYFYTPFGISTFWQETISKVETFLLNPSESINPAATLIAIRDRLRDDQNIFRFGQFWIETYPFLRVLLGDLDYLINTCEKTALQGSGLNPLPARESRWTTPTNELIQSLNNIAV